MAYEVPSLLQSQPLTQVGHSQLALQLALPREPPLGAFSCLPPSSPLLLTALNWLHFNTKSRHFFFFKALSFLESPSGRSRRWLLWTLFWLSRTNVDFSDHLVSLLECNCLGPSQFLESGVQGVSWSQVWLCTACRVTQPNLPRASGLGFLMGKVKDESDGLWAVTPCSCSVSCVSGGAARSHLDTSCQKAQERAGFPDTGQKGNS